MRTILIFAFTNILIFAYSQNYNGRNRSDGAPSGPPKIGVITGQVLEADALIPMEFVNIVIYSYKDSSLITGTITGPDGKFQIRELPFGRFYLTANFIGFEKQTIEGIAITPDKKIQDIGQIKLKAAATNLEGVEVVADKQRVVYQLDKKIVNVSQDLKSAGGSAVDVLENVPSVKVDIEGNVSLRGSSNFIVLIDGRPSVLESNDALQQIPAASIDHIEIITNPSAKYDPDGTAGIINVVMKKETERGINGIANASAGLRNKFNANLLLNYRTGKFNLFGGGDFNYREFSGEGKSVNETYQGDTTFSRDTRSENMMTRQGYGIKGGVDYFMSSKSTLTLSGKYGYYGFGRSEHSRLSFYTDPASYYNYTRSDNESNRDGNYYEITTNFQHKFNDNGHKLDLMAFFSNRTGDDEEEQIEYLTDADWISLNQVTSRYKTNEQSNTNQFTIKVDYVLPMGEKGNLEAGYQSRFDFENENYIFRNYDTITNDWVINNLYSEEFDFHRNVHSAYATYGNRWKGFEFQLGLRGEYTDRRIKNVNSPESHNLNRFDIFPSVHLSREFLEKNQVMASYSRRIQRVHPRELDPFVSYEDPYNMERGNPDLKDEYIDSWELGYQRKFKTSFVALDAYYRITNNKISDVSILQDDGIMLNTYENLNKDYSLGSELSANIDFTEWLNIFAIFNLFHYRLKGFADGQEVDQQNLSWDSRLTATLKFKYDIRVQATGSYEAPEITAQGEEKGMFMTSLSARKDFFKRKLSVTLAARDILRTAKHESTITGEGFYNYSKFRRESPIVMLTVSFRINNYKPEFKPENGEKNGEDEGEM